MRTAFLCAGLLLGCVSLLWSAAGPPRKPTKEQVTRWVKELGDERFPVRHSAFRQLWYAGRVAESALREAIEDSDDFEVVSRARTLLDRLKWGITPDTPPAIVALIDQYRKGDSTAQQNAVQALLQEGKVGFAIVRRFADLAGEGPARTQLLARLTTEKWRLARSSIAEGDLATAAEALEETLSAANEAGLRHYAAFHALRGTIPNRIRYWHTRLENKESREDAAAVLVFLYRAQGDLRGARRAAEHMSKTDLLEPVLEELGDWKALAGGKVPIKDSPVASASQRKATYLRLAGDQAGFKAELRKALPEAKKRGMQNAAYFLLFNDLPAEGIEEVRRGRSYANAFYFLALQGRLRPAFDLVEQAKKAPAVERISLAVNQARVLYRMGEKEKARSLLEKLVAEAGKDAAETWQMRQLVQVEMKLGLEDLAFNHAARLIARLRPGTTPSSLFYELFPKRWDEASRWWPFLRERFPREPVSATLDRLRTWLRRGKTSRDFTLLMREAEQSALKLPSQDERQRWLHTLADTCAGVGEDARAQAFLEKAVSDTGSTQTLTRLGDFFLGRKRWQEAAKAYGQAVAKDRGDAIALYLRGWALSQAGEKTEGAELMKRAHWLPLADHVQRYALVTALEKHGLAEQALRESVFVVRTGPFRDIYVSNLRGRIRNDALKRKDYFLAAEQYEQSWLRMLQRGGAYIETDSYLNVPCGVHQYRARGHLAAGRLDAALREAELVRAFFPLEIGVSIEVIRALDREKRKKDADALFQTVFKDLDDLCKDYPQAAWCRNSAAWLAARCRRDLDAALAHARSAVELEPASAGYLDTLAEVHFQRKEKDEAIKAIKRSIALAPKNAYYRAQLQRFEKGDRNADLPAGGR
jgi:tetratricopeptide (TPR) repeat protein